MATKGKKKQLSQRKRLAVILMTVGVKQKKVAEIVGVLPQQISRWKRDEAFGEYLEEKVAELEGEVEAARDLLIQSASLAALKMLVLLDCGDEQVMLRAASQILDRVGLARTTELQIEQKGGTMWDLIQGLMEKEDEDEPES